MATMDVGQLAEHARKLVSAFRRQNQDTREANMHLYLMNKMHESKTDPLTFFRIAHVHLFGTDPDMHNLVARYKIDGIIPQHVVQYLKRLQESER